MRLKEKCDKKVSISNNVNMHKKNCINIKIIYKKYILIFHRIGKKHI